MSAPIATFPPRATISCTAFPVTLWGERGGVLERRHLAGAYDGKNPGFGVAIRPGRITQLLRRVPKKLPAQRLRFDEALCLSSFRISFSAALTRGQKFSNAA